LGYGYAGRTLWVFAFFAPFFYYFFKSIFMKDLNHVICVSGFAECTGNLILAPEG